MKIKYSNESIDLIGHPSIFLAGPTLRISHNAAEQIDSDRQYRWRLDAIDYLQKMNFDGTVLIPERSNGFAKFDYLDQTEWEYFGLNNCSKIVFWIPRSDILPGFTTNVEFGYWLAKRPDSIVYGRPQGAPKTQYLDWLWSKHRQSLPLDNLEEVMKNSVN